MTTEDDFLGQMFEDSQNVVVSNDGLKQISAIAEKMAQEQGEIEALEESLKNAKERLRKLEELDLPQAMDTAGVKEFTLTNGAKVKVEDVVHANIPKAFEVPAFEYLRKTGNGDLIKNEVKAKFGRGQEEFANKLIQFATSIGIEAEQKSAVAWNTLTAWVKEQRSAGVNLPEDILGIYSGRKAKIVMPKARK